MAETQLDMSVRSTGIGASEVAALMGLNPYATPLDIYLRKLGLVEEAFGNQYTRWGLLLEPAIADAYAEETGVELTGDGRTTYRHPDYEFAICTPDRIAVDGSRLVEIKTANVRMTSSWGEPGTDQVPEQYLIQCAWQMAVMNIDRCDIAVLIGGNDFRIYTINRDRDLEATLLDLAARFWRNNVVAQEPPDAANEDEMARVLAARYPQDSGEVIEADEALTIMAVDLKAVKDGIKALEAEEQTLENAIKARLGDKTGCTGSFGKITWKTTADRSVIDYKALCAAVPPEVVKAHTSIKPGLRRFLALWAKESK